MNMYMVAVTVKGRKYLVNIIASNIIGAENHFKDFKTVEKVQAFGIKEMKTDAFIETALSHCTISVTELMQIINKGE